MIATCVTSPSYSNWFLLVGFESASMLYTHLQGIPNNSTRLSTSKVCSQLAYWQQVRWLPAKCQEVGWYIWRSSRSMAIEKFKPIVDQISLLLYIQLLKVKDGYKKGSAVTTFLLTSIWTSSLHSIIVTTVWCTSESFSKDCIKSNILTTIWFDKMKSFP